MCARACAAAWRRLRAATRPPPAPTARRPCRRARPAPAARDRRARPARKKGGRRQWQPLALRARTPHRLRPASHNARARRRGAAAAARATHNQRLDVGAKVAAQRKKLHQAVHLKLVARPHVRVEHSFDLRGRGGGSARVAAGGPPAAKRAAANGARAARACRTMASVPARISAASDALSPAAAAAAALADVAYVCSSTFSTSSMPSHTRSSPAL